MKSINRQGAMEIVTKFPLTVNWCLTDMCNYECEYCFEVRKIDTSKFSTQTQILKALNTLSAISRSEYAFTLVGGEPTVHPCFWLIMDYLSNGKMKIRYVNIVTNGSQKSSWYSKLISYTDYMDIKLIISVHLQYVSFEHIEEIIKIISKQVFVQLNLMLEPDNFDEVVAFYNKIKELRQTYAFDISINLLREGPNFDVIDRRYSNEMLAWREIAREEFDAIKDNSDVALPTNYEKTYFTKYVDYNEDGKRVFDCNYERNKWLLEGKLNYYGMFCISGEAVLRINSNGNCKGMVCGASKYVINLFEDNPFSYDDWIHMVQCPMRNCGCISNHIISKFKSECEARKYVELIRDRQKIIKSFNE